MNNQRNKATYKVWAPIYDFVMHPIYGRARQRAISLLNLKNGENVLIPGVGTGLDFPLIPVGVHITGIDLTPSMMEKAKAKIENKNVTLKVMNAQKLEFKSGSFDAVILNLILSVVPDGAVAFREVWRVLRPGGRVVIFDKFLPENESLSPLRKLLGIFIRVIGTDPNRRLSDIFTEVPDIIIKGNESSLLRGQYRIVLLQKNLLIENTK